MAELRQKRERSALFYVIIFFLLAIFNHLLIYNINLKLEIPDLSILYRPITKIMIYR